MATAEDEFHQAMLGIYEVEKAHGYYATYFKSMVDSLGGVQAAKSLLAKTEIQEGLMTLWKMGHLSNSVEAHVLDPKFKELFTPDELAEARRRLDELGHTIPD